MKLLMMCLTGSMCLRARSITSCEAICRMRWDAYQICRSCALGTIDFMETCLQNGLA